jgi:outer membrane lipoprotein-sorting protein
MKKIQHLGLFYGFLVFIWIGVLGCASSKNTSLKEIKTFKDYQEVPLAKLISLINTQAQSIYNLKSSIFIDFKSINTEKKQSIQARLAVERPDKVLLISFKELLPTFFTMVSDGTQFWLHIPSKREVFIGKNHPRRLNTRQENPIYSLRPYHLVDALLLEEINPEETSHLVYMEVVPGSYIINVGNRGEAGSGYYPQRRIFIEQKTLRIRRYQSFNEKSVLISDVTYDNYGKVEKIQFPYRVTIQRPWEGIEVTLIFREVEINTDLNPKMFTFSLPKDHKVVELEN